MFLHIYIYMYVVDVQAGMDMKMDAILFTYQLWFIDQWLGSRVQPCRSAYWLVCESQ